MADVRRAFHFVFGLREQREPFHLVHYLCLESCRQLHPGVPIHLHLRHEPFGEWWQRIASWLVIHRLPVAELPFDARRYADSREGRYIEQAGFFYAHEADFIRLQILIEHGGVYADMDTLFVRPYPDEYFSAEFMLGEEAPIRRDNGLLQPSLCNAVICAQPQAVFARRWLDRMAEVFDGTWNRHSCDEAARLWQSMPDSVQVAPQRVFYPFGATAEGISNLFQRCASLPPNSCSLHLWAHLWWSPLRADFSEFHAGLFNVDFIRNVDTTYNVLARRFLR